MNVIQVAQEGVSFITECRTGEKKMWVDPISIPQLQIGFKQFWKFCLNLGSRK